MKINESLHELSSAFHDIGKMIDDGEIDFNQISDQLDAIESTFDQKVINCGLMVNEIESAQDRIDSEINRLKRRSEILKNKSSFLKEYIYSNMTRINKTKVVDDLVTLTICKGRDILSIDNEDDIDNKYVEIEVVEKVDKKQLLKDLKEQIKLLASDPDYEIEEIKGASVKKSNSYLKIT